MKHKYFFVSLLHLLAYIGFMPMAVGQYTFSSSWFQDPELILEYTDDCALFWEGVKDPIYGGFYTDVDRSGSALDYNTKGIVPLSRDAYGFTRAFMMTGKKEYLEYAESALDFMYEHLWDTTFGGWYKFSDRDGSNPYQSHKSAFDQHYALLGITAFWEATDKDEAWNMLSKGYQFNEDHLWDASPDMYGYFDQLSVTGTSGWNKSFNATVDAITTHVYNLYLLTGDQKYYDRLIELKQNILDHLVTSMDQQAIGFAEKYTTEWEIAFTDERTIMGHVLKTAWCLARIHRISPDAVAIEAADKLIQDVLAKGYDHEYGGPYKDYNRLTGEMFMYGAYDTAKAWWQMEQAVTAGLLMYEITGNTTYLEMADESIDFFSEYFVDPVYGEIYADRARDGGKVAYPGGFWDENKGSIYKAAYHSIETGYYTYLYAKLLLKNEPVSLYYDFKAENEERNLRMNPLAIYFDNLKIKEVTRDDVVYENYNPNTRILTIPAGTAGLFKVTYSYTPTEISEQISKSGFRLYGNYPNPSKEYTTIRFRLAEPSRVLISVYNSMGVLADEIRDDYLGEGAHSVIWNTLYLPPGVYIYTITAQQSTNTGKVIVVD